jgi:hypothetical protein
MLGQSTFMDNSYGARYAHERAMLERQLRDQQQGRDFQGQQAGLDRSFQSTERAAQDQRDWRNLLQTQGFQGTQAGADRQFAFDQAAANRAFQGDESRAARDFQGGQAGLDRDLAWRTLLSQQGFQGAQADATRAFEGTQRGADRDLTGRLAADANAVTSRGQDLQFRAAELPWQYRRDVFGQVMPLIQGLAGGVGGSGGSAAFDQALQLVGGQNGPLPGLPSAEVFSPQQVQQQVNAGVAQNDQRAATASRAAAEDTASRGFGSRSPLLMALQSQIGTATGAANADFGRETRMRAAEANAQQGLQVAGLANQQYQLANDGDIRRRQAATNYLGQNQANAMQLIAALAGLAG